MSLEWNHSFTTIIAGPTSCRTSFFMKFFLNEIDSLIDTNISEVIYCLPENQPIDSFFLKYAVCREIPEIERFKYQLSRLIILDDLMREAENNVVDLFTKGSHHCNISVIFDAQNIFNQGKGRRDISLNSHYIICFKNSRDKQQIRTLPLQVCPENPKYIQEA